MPSIEKIEIVYAYFNELFISSFFVKIDKKKLNVCDLRPRSPSITALVRLISSSYSWKFCDNLKSFKKLGNAFNYSDVFNYFASTFN